MDQKKLRPSLLLIAVLIALGLAFIAILIGRFAWPARWSRGSQPP